MEIKIKKSSLKYLLTAAILLYGVFYLFPLISSGIGLNAQSKNLFTIFLTGLFVGGLTCMAVQGGLLAAVIANREEDSIKKKIKINPVLPLLAFILAKLLVYTFLGFLLGWLGSAFQISLRVQTILNFAVIIFMLGTAFNILEVHPVFRYFVIQPPRFLTRLVRKQSKSKDIFAPALLGAFTVFIPCGTTQAMMALAIASGSPLYGAAILFAFTIGTSPLFFTLGYMATSLGEKLKQQFMRAAAFALILLAFFNLNNAIALTGSSFIPSNLISGIWCSVSVCEDNIASVPSRQVALSDQAVEITSNGYSPEQLTVKAGSQVTLNLKNTGGSGCTQAFTIPSLGIQKVVPLGTSNKLVFIAPNQPGAIPFMCSMGMYRGVINVI